MPLDLPSLHVRFDIGKHGGGAGWGSRFGPCHSLCGTLLGRYRAVDLQML